MAPDNVESPQAANLSDSVTVVSERGLLSRLGGSLGTALLGIVFFFGSFVVLYLNEGTVNEATLAKDAAAISAEKPDAGQVGKFVAASGLLVSQGQLGDAYLGAGNYLILVRKAEMFAWEEHKESTTEIQTGGSEKTITTYSYERAWTSSPDDSSSFHRSEGHRNPPMWVKSETYRVEQASVGALALQMDKVSLPGTRPLALANLKTQGGQISGDHLYLAPSRPEEPRVGDVRVSYAALTPGGNYTVLGKLESVSSIGPAKLDDREMYRVFKGSKEDALKTLQTEYTLWIWGFRLLGFLLCWGGLRMMMSPLNTLLDIFPFLGNMGRGLTGFVTFPIALVLSGLTIVVAWITHSLIAMIAIGLVALVVGIKLLGAKKPAALAAGKAA